MKRARTSGSVLFAVAIGAGLVTGLSRFTDPASAALAVGGGALVLRRRTAAAVASFFSLAVLVGVWTGTVALTHCGRVLPLGDRQVVVRAVDPGSGRGRVKVLAEGCHGLIDARWPNGVDLPPGVTLTVNARWRSRAGPLGRPDGLLSIRSVGAARGEAGLVGRSRAAVVNAIQREFGIHAPLVEALITGRRGGVDPTIRRSFTASGMIHLLAISGLHIGLIAGWLLIGLRLCRVAPRYSEAAAVVAVLCYAGWLGWPPAATRAAVMLALLTGCRIRQRAVTPGSMLGMAAVIVMTIDPWVVTRVGGWLSFAAVAGVIHMRRWIAAVSSPVGWFHDALAASIGATIATAPLVAISLGRVALIGTAINLIAIPVVGLTVPAILAALILEPVFPMISTGFVSSATFLLDVLLELSRWGEGLPGSALEGPATRVQVGFWIWSLMTLLWATAGRTSPSEAGRRLLWSIAILAAFILIVPGPVSSIGSGRLALHFLDIGQGDAIAIETPRGRWVLVDAGPGDLQWDAGARIVVPRLKRLGARRVEALILTHPHRDHIGGALAVVDAMSVGVVMEPGIPFSDPGYRALLSEITSRRVGWRTVAEGAAWTLDGVQFRVVHPVRGMRQQWEDVNESSIVLEICWLDFCSLLTGDAGQKAEAEYWSSLGDIDLLKVGHHGSRGATGEGLLAAIRPLVAVISSGRNNYGHPAIEVLSRLRRYQVGLWRTDREGDITVTSDGRLFTVQGGRSIATFDASEPIPKDVSCCTKLR